MRDPGEAEAVAASLYDVRASDPDGVLVDRTGVADEELPQIADLMTAVSELREAERRLAEVSREYMRLGETDMRALHFLIVCENQGVIATPSAIAQHLGISTASTTKLLDRLFRAGHVERHPHPTDRRSLAIRVTTSTREAAMATVGRQQARRFQAAARLAPEERALVARFLRDMAGLIDPAAGADDD